MVSFAHLRIKTALSIDSVVAVLQIGVLLMLAHFDALSSAFRAFWVVGVACGLTGGFWLFTQSGKLTLNIPQALADFKRNWKFSKWLAATFPVANLRTQLSPWLLAFFYGLSSTGLFAACLNLASTANPFVMGVGNFLGPKAAQSYARGGVSPLRRFVLLAYVPIGLGMAVFCLGMLVFGGRLVQLVYGDDYVGLGMVVAVLASGAFVMSLSSPANRGLLALEMSRETFFAEFLILIVMATLGLFLILTFGIVGAALAVLFAYIAGSAFQIIIFIFRVFRTDFQSKDRHVEL
jgi:O-antigen/teichoic acid export membrane protein